jgi:hypothetical protein
MPNATRGEEVTVPSRDDTARVVTTAVIREAIASIVFDRGTSMGTITRHDGVSATMELSSAMFEPSSTIARVTYLPDEDFVRFLTVRGDEVVAEMPPDGDASPIDGRPVLYLDQKDWSLLATSVHEPSRLTPQDRAAARTVIQLAEAGRVVLPMSSGHMTETCKWADRDRRYRLALTITGLSRGWQMRSPIAIRIHELRQSLLSTLRGVERRPVDVFTLEPNALYPPDAVAGSARFDELPPDLARVMNALTSVSAMFDTMLDADAITPDVIPGWVQRQRQFTDSLSELAGSRSERDRKVDVFFLVDTTPELATVLTTEGIATREVDEWIQEHQDGEVAAMPSLGLFREVLRGRHLNPGSTWESNDLTDMMYLCCGAGYADHVVGERSTIAQIEQAAARLGRDVSVHRRIRDVVPLLPGT